MTFLVCLYGPLVPSEGSFKGEIGPYEGYLTLRGSPKILSEHTFMLVSGLTEDGREVFFLWANSTAHRRICVYDSCREDVRQGCTVHRASI